MSLKTQQVRSTLLYNSIDAARHGRVSWMGVDLGLPDWKMSHIGTVAVSHPDRRFRSEAASSLCLIKWIGSRRQRRRARALLEEVAATGDAVLVGSARCGEDPHRAK